MLNRVPKNFIAVIMKEKIGKNEYPDPLTFFWNDVQFCYYTDYRVTEIQKNFFWKWRKRLRGGLYKTKK